MAALLLVPLSGCRSRISLMKVPDRPMPPNTILLSRMMEGLSAKPGFTDAMMRQLQDGSKVGAALLTPTLLDRMRVLIVGKDWRGLGRFPGWSMDEITPTVRVAGTIAGKAPSNSLPAADGSAASTVSAAATSQPGAVQPPAGSASSLAQVARFVDYGPYTLDQPIDEDLDRPPDRTGFSQDESVRPLGEDVVRGDGPDPQIAALHSESKRLAEVLNRLSLNGLEGVQPITVELRGNPQNVSVPDDEKDREEAMQEIAAGELKGDGSAMLSGLIGSPGELVQALLDTGHTVVVSDARFFANFGHLHYKGQDVMMPFWVNTKIKVPGTDRLLLVPVAHAEYEWVVRGPRINADVSFYFGIDGKAEFRTMDQKDQAWVMGRHAHEYRGDDAVEVTRLAGEMLVAYEHEHARRPQLPFGGYYALGVCQDGVSAIEQKMNGRVTLFPNTVDMTLFNDPRDGEINHLLALIPMDRSGTAPEVERVFGSLPTTDLRDIAIPGLAADLVTVQMAWHSGDLRRALSLAQIAGLVLLLLVGIVLLYGLIVIVRDQMTPRKDM